ncbi:MULTISPECIES: hypothetical protein [unclassified Pseudomonas]|uniref:hypothetical protein n=1 Tax=unclassified Pseudomonas TaxID=196821 RepID=UPI0006D3F69C|nr:MULTISPECIES: hypothetical protein [unclassified Pseudomonas]
MKLEDVKSLRTVNHQSQAQRLVNEGWQILAVCVRQDGADQYAEYHLGNAMPPEPLEKFDPETIRSAVMAAQGRVIGPVE